MRQIFIGIIFLLIIGTVHALESGDSPNFIQGLDITDVITIAASILALILGTISFIGYRRDGRAKLLFTTLAFFTFALKGLLIITSDMFFIQQAILDIIASLLDFLVLLFFFIGMIKK